VSDYGELEVMRDILLDDEYDLPESFAPAVILDVGANIGLAALRFRASYPDAAIVAIEPDPESFAKLEHNVGGDRRIHLVKAAAAGRRGELPLFRPAGYSIGSSLKSGGTHAGEHARVRAETLDGLCAEFGLSQIDLVKLDVEGAELDVLRGFSRRDQVRVIIGEAHPHLLGGGLDEFFELLAAFEVSRLSESDNAIAFLAVAPT
jgi:FkbM family methyltransferase